MFKPLFGPCLPERSRGGIWFFQPVQIIPWAKCVRIIGLLIHAT